ncbi:copper-exporting ATPase [Echria macrotheca]|uniref:Copper-exporting ATPase n=1 Tax=Echria macrotheca TaxID=438768 RepID=A0AAJ0F6G7_9PEZI|nr:copper-exporting ATPase [Echria macrotheca]
MAPSSTIPAMSSSETATTNFLVGNLHCPTCVSAIKAALLESCPGQIHWVSPNVVTSVVTVEHDLAASISQMHQALEDSGFEIRGVTSTTGELPDWNPEVTAGRNSQGESSTAPDMARPAFLTRWITSSRLSHRSPDSQSHNASAHLINCEQCRSAAAPNVSEKQVLEATSHHSEPASDVTSQAGPGPQTKMSSKDFVVIETEDDVENPPLWRASLAIGGMTCAACDWIADVAVNLVNNSATVLLKDGRRADDLVDAIEDLGYEATLDTLEDLHKEKKAGQEKSDTWRAAIAIGGMTCAACANNITKEMKKRDWVKDITVNLVTNSAAMEFEGLSNKDKIVEAIEDLGYEATIDSVTNVGEEPEERQERTVEIKIEGIYCDHCPSRVVNSLGGFQRSLEVITPPTRQRPIIKISYVPEAPTFTIRQILAAIEASDPEFSASIYHPPTLEERSKLIQRQHQRQILFRVILTGIVCIPTFIIGIVYMSLLPDHDMNKHFLMEPWTSGISRAQIALFIMATPIYFCAADLFHKRAFKEIRALWRPGSRVPIIQRFYRFGSMNTLMSLGTTIAYVSSVSQMIAAAVGNPEEVKDANFYFDSVVFLTFFLLVGRLIESYSKSRTGDAVEMLGRLRPTTATLVQWYGTEKEEDTVVNADMLDFGDVVRVTHGGSPPADGTVVQGESNFDESSLTGESRLVKKVPGDQVFSGTVNKDGSLLVRITGTAGQSMLDQIVRVVREGQTKRAPIEQFADILTAYFVPAVTLIAILTWIIWMSLGFSGQIPGHFLDVSSGGWVAFSLQFAIAVFVVACPCGLALAAPTAIFVGGGLAAKYGILAKGGGLAFEKASRVDCVVFDKTGTITVGGAPSITDSEIVPESEDEKAVLLAALKAVEENSSHPIAKAIVAFCADKTALKAQIDTQQEVPGKGIKATYRGDTPQKSFDIVVGNEGFMQDFQVDIPAAIAESLEKWKTEAKSVALVATRPVEWTGSEVWTLAAALSISDPIRPEARQIIRTLESRGTRVWMLSGDNPTTAVAVAKQVGIPSDQVIAGVLPTGKADQIKYLQSTVKARKGKHESATRRALIAMVGDGINDSPALAMADVGVAIGSGSDVAISSADFVLVKSDLWAVVTLLDLSKTVFRRIKFNFGWALVYNVVAVPIAAGHIRLDPVISVVLSSLALRSRFLGLGFRERRVTCRGHIEQTGSGRTPATGGGTLQPATMGPLIHLDLPVAQWNSLKRKFNALLGSISSSNASSGTVPQDTTTTGAPSLEQPRDASSDSNTLLAQATSTPPRASLLPSSSPSSAAAMGSSELEFLAKKRRVAGPTTTTPSKYGALRTTEGASPLRPGGGTTTISNITLRKWTPSGSPAPTVAGTPTKKDEAPRYCPGDREQLVRRLATFQELTDWTPKPDRVSEVEWAKRGWVCAGKERVRCVLCTRELGVRINRKEVDGREIAVMIASEIEHSVVDKYAELIVEAHAEDCLWRKKGCDDSLLRLPLVNAKQVLADLRKRYDELYERKDFIPYEFNLRLPEGLDIDTVMSYLLPTFFTDPPPPVNKALPADTLVPHTPNRPALALALLGWQSLTNARVGPVPNSASCHTCLRRLGLWMFKSKEIDPETNAVLVPAPMDHLDPLREHRFFCPWKNGAAQRNAGAKPLGTGEQDKAGWEVLVQVLRNDAFVRQRTSVAHSRSKSSVPPRTTVTGSDGLVPGAGGIAKTPERPLTAAGYVQEDEDDEEGTKKKDLAMMSRLRRVKSLFNTKAGNRLKRLGSRPGTAHSNAGG